jgi:hypothetical protein
MSDKRYSPKEQKMDERERKDEQRKGERRDNQKENSRVIDRPKPETPPPVQRDRSNTKDKK